jgi:very-short-patch-repair endonuclease
MTIISLRPRRGDKCNLTPGASPGWRGGAEERGMEGFVADLYCDETKLAVEVDGNIHELERVKQIDLLKENVFEARGLFILRFKTETVINEIKSISHKRLCI